MSKLLIKDLSISYEGLRDLSLDELQIMGGTPNPFIQANPILAPVLLLGAAFAVGYLTGTAINQVVIEPIQEIIRNW
jgi:hypothetical protein